MHTAMMSAARSAAGAVAPDAPSDPLVQQLSSTSQRVSWQDNSSNEDEFVIYRDGSEHDTVGANVTEYDDTGLTSGTEYSYRVSARNESGESSKTSSVSGTPADEVPNAPTGFSLSLGSDSPELDASWSDNSSNEDGFRVIDEADGSVVKSVGAGVTSTTLTASDGIDSDTEYTMHVEAFNSGGSSSSNSDTQKTALIAPTLTLTRETAGGEGGGSDWAQLDWTTPNDDAKRSEWGIYRNGTLIDTVSDDNLPTYADSEASVGDEYHVTARGSFPESSPSNKETYSSDA